MSRQSERVKKASRRERQERDVDRKEKELSRLVFGAFCSQPESSLGLGSSGDNGKGIEKDKNGLVSNHGKRTLPLSASEVETPDDSNAAWKDGDDSSLVVSADSGNRLKKLRDSREVANWHTNELERRLRQRFEKTANRSSRTKWADVDHGDAGKGSLLTDSDDYVEAESATLFSRTGESIPPNSIEMVRLKDANAIDPSDAVLRTVSFHPQSDPDSPLLMTAGLDKSMRFYSIGQDEETRKIHGIHFQKLPIYKASFLPDSNSVIITGRRPFFYTYDMVAGKVDFVPGVMGREEKSWETHFVSKDGKMVAFLGNDGYVVLLNPHSKQAIGSLKLNGSVRSAVFTADGTHLLASGSDGDITRWDLGTRRCIERFSNNDGSVTASLDSTDRFFAAGAESGVVNLYSCTTTGSFGRNPIRSIMNLSTVVDRLTFNHDGQILAMSSRFSSDCLKLLHVPSRTVFANWPTSKTPLNYVFSMDFSPQSRFFAVGNDKGKCLLYKLKHYEGR